MGKSARPRQPPGWLARARARSRGGVSALAALAVLLVAVRVALPSVVRSRMNRALDSLGDYHGHVDDVGLGLWRGAYVLSHLRLTKRAGEVSVPFLDVERIDFSIAWRELWHRRIVADITLTRPEVNFVQGPSAQASQLQADRRWQDVVRKIFPIDITHVKIVGGRVHYVNSARTPRVDVSIANLEALATGLQNRATLASGEFPSQVTIAGDTIGGGQLRVAMALEPLAAQPHFLLKLQLQEVALPALNEFLQAYAGIDVSAGVFAAFTEIEARNGRFSGYFKPFFQHVDFSPLPGEKRSLGEEIRTFGARVFAWIFRNSQRDQVATRIPFSGEFSNWNVGLWPTVVTLVRNGFVQALPQKLDSASGNRPVAPAHPAER